MRDEEITAPVAEMLVRCGIERGVLGRIDADNVARILLPVVREIADQRAAEAWDEGYDAAEHDALCRPYSDQPAAATWKPIPNPYRAADLRGEAGR